MAQGEVLLLGGLCSRSHDGHHRDLSVQPGERTGLDKGQRTREDLGNGLVGGGSRASPKAWKADRLV